MGKKVKSCDDCRCINICEIITQVSNFEEDCLHNFKHGYEMSDKLREIIVKNCEYFISNGGM